MGESAGVSPSASWGIVLVLELVLVVEISGEAKKYIFLQRGGRSFFVGS